MEGISFGAGGGGGLCSFVASQLTIYIQSILFKVGFCLLAFGKQCVQLFL